MKSILLTTDLSSESKQAFAIAKQVTIKFDAQLHLGFVAAEIFALPTTYGLESSVYFDPAMQKEINSKLKGDLEKIASEEFYEFKVDTILNEGSISPHEGILDIADLVKADLIIIASHGRTGISRVLMGSVTERVLRAATCPVLVVPVKKDS